MMDWVRVRSTVAAGRAAAAAAGGGGWVDSIGFTTDSAEEERGPRGDTWTRGAAEWQRVSHGHTASVPVSSTRLLSAPWPALLLVVVMLDWDAVSLCTRPPLDRHGLEQAQPIAGRPSAPPTDRTRVIPPTRPSLTSRVGLLLLAAGSSKRATKDVSRTLDTHQHKAKETTAKDRRRKRNDSRRTIHIENVVSSIIHPIK